MRAFTFFKSSSASLIGFGLLVTAGCGGGGRTGTAVPTPNPTTGPVLSQDLSSNLLQLSIPTGPLKGGFRLMKDDGRLNWYFCNLGLVPFVNASNKDLVRGYLDLKRRNLL